MLDRILLRFRPWRSKQSWQEDQIMWGSIKQPVPDSYTVESSSASKENPTCEDDGMMLSNIEIRQDTSNFLSATPCLPCIYALDTKFLQNKFIPTILSMLDTKSGPRPPKIRNWVLADYARYPSAVWCNMLLTSLDDVPHHQIVESIVLSNVWHCYAEEHANPASWQSGLRSDRSGKKPWCRSVQYNDCHRS